MPCNVRGFGRNNLPVRLPLLVVVDGCGCRLRPSRYANGSNSRLGFSYEPEFFLREVSRSLGASRLPRFPSTKDEDLSRRLLEVSILKLSLFDWGIN